MLKRKYRSKTNTQWVGVRSGRSNKSQGRRNPSFLNSINFYENFKEFKGTNSKLQAPNLILEKGVKEEGSNTRKSEGSQDQGTLVYTLFLL
ncbi:hypothetical protein Hdeb2414_s0019g00549161 [Helianthus debilis subsp. tardiflorus]